jgi:hypothetical protein
VNQDKHDRINALFGGDKPIKPMSMTGRFRTPSPNLPRYMMRPPACPCLNCAQGEQVETPLHPCAYHYAITKSFDREREWQQQRRARLLNAEIQLSKDRRRILW